MRVTRITYAAKIARGAYRPDIESAIALVGRTRRWRKPSHVVLGQRAFLPVQLVRTATLRRAPTRAMEDTRSNPSVEPVSGTAGCSAVAALSVKVTETEAWADVSKPKSSKVDLLATGVANAR